MASDAGLPLGERTHWYDSTLAHEAAEWARAQGDQALEEAFRRSIFGAYFAENRNIADPAVLLDIASARYTAEQLAALRVALVERRYRDDVQRQYGEARAIGVTGVPTTIAGEYALIGAQPDEQFERLMEAAGASRRVQ